MKCPLKLHTENIQGKVRVCKKIMFLSTDQPAKLLNHWGKNAEVETIIENKAGKEKGYFEKNYRQITFLEKQKQLFHQFRSYLMYTL